jgi:Chitobiase/beta-hexosaminidase C-terminal domain
MSESNNILEVLQADVLAFLQSVPGLVDAKHLADNAGDIESRVIKSLAPVSGGSTDKAGLSVVVLLPEVDTVEENLPGPPATVRVEVQTLEQVMLNRGDSGTGLRSSQAAMEVLRALHHHRLGDYLLYADKNPVKPVPVKAGYLSHSVSMLVRTSGVQEPGKVSAIAPSIATVEEEDIITLTCATAGAEIHYTTDGSYPSEANATLYTAPFTAPEVGTTVRAVATASPHNPSDLLEFIITE